MSTTSEDPQEVVRLAHTATCLAVTLTLAALVTTLTLWRPSLTLSPAHSRLPLLQYLAAYLHHLYAAFPSCVFKFNHWRNGSNLKWDVLDKATTDSICVVTGVRPDGGIGFETCLALLKTGNVRRVYAGVHSCGDGKILLQVRAEMQRRLGAKFDEEKFIPIAMDLTDFSTSYRSASTLKAALLSHDDHAIHYFIGTVGMGFDRPTKGEPYTCRYTENDDGVEFQTGVNAVGTLVLILSLLKWFGVDVRGDSAVSPALSAGSFESTKKVTEFAAAAPRAPSRIILTSSVAHFWSTLPPFTVKPRYGPWDALRKDGQSRTNAGRYSFSKLVQLHLLTSLSRLLSTTPTPPLLFALHPGEVRTPFLEAFLPTWWLGTKFGQWNNDFWCHSPFKGAWTGLYACVVNPSITAYGYTYLTGLCTVTQPSLVARDEELIRDCWRLFEPRLGEWFENVGEKEVGELLSRCRR